MKKITLKVKHILVLIPLIIIISFAGVQLLSRTMDKKLEKTNQVLKIYTSTTLNKEEKGEKLYELAGLNENNFAGIISSNGSSNLGGNEVIKESTIDNAIQCFKKIMELGEDNSYYERAYNATIRLYFMKGDYKEALKLIEEGFNKSKNISLAAAKHKIMYLLSEGKYEEAEVLALEILDNNKQDRDTHIIVGYVYYFKGSIDKMRGFWSMNMNVDYKQIGPENSVATWYSLGYRSDWNISKDMDERERKGKGKIIGKVVVDGKPMPFTLVWISRNQNHMLNIWGIFESKFTFTNSKGEYLINDIEEGIYYQGVAIPKHLLINTILQQDTERNVFIKENVTTNKDLTFVKTIPLNLKGELSLEKKDVKLTWPKIEGVSYYRIGFGIRVGSIVASSMFPNKIYNEEYVLNYDEFLQEIFMISSGFITSVDDRKINPEYFIGPLPGSDIIIYIQGYNEKESLINSSRAHITDSKDLTIIKIPSRELSPGEKLIIEGDYENAFKYYEKAVAEEPKNIKDAKILLTIYSRGMIFDEDYKEAKYRDVRKAIELNNAIYIMTEDTKYFIESLLKIEAENIQEAQYIEKEYDKVKEEILPYDYYFRIASNYTRIGKLEEASRMYAKALGTLNFDKGMRFEGVLLRLYLEESWEEFLDSCDLRSYRINKEAFKINLKDMQSKYKNSKDYLLYKQALEVLINEERKVRENKFLEIYNNSTGDLKIVLKDMGVYFSYIKD